MDLNRSLNAGDKNIALENAGLFFSNLQLIHFSLSLMSSLYLKKVINFLNIFGKDYFYLAQVNGNIFFYLPFQKYLSGLVM